MLLATSVLVQQVHCRSVTWMRTLFFAMYIIAHSSDTCHLLIFIIVYYFITIISADKGLSSLLKSQTDLELLFVKWNSSHTNLTDKCLTTLHSSKLKSVTLVALDQLTNNGLITLAKNCPNICELMVPRCNQLTDVCFQAVTTLLKGMLVSVI